MMWECNFKGLENHDFIDFLVRVPWLVWCPAGILAGGPVSGECVHKMPSFLVNHVFSYFREELSF
jgi:hypothetical protein